MNIFCVVRQVSYFENKLIREVRWRDMRRLIGQTYIILNQHLLLTGNRGEYLRVLRIKNDGRIDRKISLVCSPFQSYAIITN